jgi:hypothetical protein
VIRAQDLDDSVFRSDRIGRWSAYSAWAVVTWSLVELPVEIGLARTSPDVLALVLSKLILAILVCLMLRKMAWARYLFLLLCALSVLAIAPRLWTEYKVFPFAFVLSLGELILKLLALALIGASLFRRSAD